MKFLKLLIVIAIGFGVWGRFHKSDDVRDGGSSGTVTITFTDAEDLVRKLAQVKSATRVEFRSEGIPCASDAATKAAYRSKVEREMAMAQPRIAAELARIQGALER